MSTIIIIILFIGFYIWYHFANAPIKYLVRIEDPISGTMQFVTHIDGVSKTYIYSPDATKAFEFLDMNEAIRAADFCYDGTATVYVISYKLTQPLKAVYVKKIDIDMILGRD